MGGALELSSRCMGEARQALHGARRGVARKIGNFVRGHAARRSSQRVRERRRLVRTGWQDLRHPQTVALASPLHGWRANANVVARYRHRTPGSPERRPEPMPHAPAPEGGKREGASRRRPQAHCPEHFRAKSLRPTPPTGRRGLRRGGSATTSVVGPRSQFELVLCMAPTRDLPPVEIECHRRCHGLAQGIRSTGRRRLAGTARKSSSAPVPGLGYHSRVRFRGEPIMEPPSRPSRTRPDWFGASGRLGTSRMGCLTHIGAGSTNCCSDTPTCCWRPSSRCRRPVDREAVRTSASAFLM